MKSLTSKIVIVLIVVLIAGVGFIIGSHFNDSAHAVSMAKDETSQGTITPASDSQDDITTIYNNASPAVVEIDVTQQDYGFFGESTGQGSGFLVDNQGDILTNDHVVEGATNVQVTLKNGKSVSAKVMGTNSTDDLAVIKIDPSSVAGITPLQFGDSNTIQPGQEVIAIGSPYGLTDSIANGIISGLNRSVSNDDMTGYGNNMTGMLQTNAAINPGNSGGPLLDINGLVIGINTEIENSANGGIGFAVPSNVAQKALPGLLAGSNSSPMTTQSNPFSGLPQIFR